VGVGSCSANDANLNPYLRLSSASFSQNCGTEQIDVACINTPWKCTNENFRGYTDYNQCRSDCVARQAGSCVDNTDSAALKTVAYVWKFYDNACGGTTTTTWNCINGNSCQPAPAGTTGAFTDGNCNNQCPSPITPKYKCSGNSCTRDDVGGGYSNPNCDNACNTPTPICNTSASVSISPNRVQNGEMMTFTSNGDTSTYIVDEFPQGGVVNYPSNAVDRAWSFYGTASGVAGRTYTWTRKWNHCEGNVNNCSTQCSVSAQFTIYAASTPIPTNTPTPTPSPTPTPTPTPTCLATYTQQGNGILFNVVNPPVGFIFYPVGTTWQLGQANGIDIGTNTVPALGTYHNPGLLTISFVYSGIQRSVCITLPAVPTPTPTSILPTNTPTPTPTGVPIAMCQQIKVYRGNPLVEIATSDIQKGDRITFRAFANATNTTVSTIRFTVTVGTGAPTNYDRTASLVGGVYQADLQLDITQATDYRVTAQPI
jgi:hypothetical protein